MARLQLAGFWADRVNFFTVEGEGEDDGLSSEAEASFRGDVYYIGKLPLGEDVDRAVLLNPPDGAEVELYLVSGIFQEEVEEESLWRANLEDEDSSRMTTVAEEVSLLDAMRAVHEALEAYQ